MNTNDFRGALESELSRSFGVTAENAAVWQLHDSISRVVMENISAQWKQSTEQHMSGRRAMYLSMEFLMGRAVYNNLLCLGLTEVVDEALKAHGRSL
ncbi:MAG: glycogen phosphorylase, partial [Ruminococcus sp.]|nr:glycogen phosphorylase [Ruminococcus sp.]